MASGRGASDYQRGIINRYYEHRDTLMLQKLSEIVSDLYLSEDPRKAGSLWKSALTALKNLKVDEKKASNVIARRDVNKLAELVQQLTSADPARGQALGETLPPEAPASIEKPASPAPPKPSEPRSPTDPAYLNQALRAFRKRLKLTRLDEESRLTVRPLTSGMQSDIVAIQPPNQFPAAVWEELVRQGRLKRAGRGFYQLVN